jgi:hypothetical protein
MKENKKATKFLDGIKADVIHAKDELHNLAEDVEVSVFDLDQMPLDEILANGGRVDDLLKDIKRQRLEFNSKLKDFEVKMKILRDFF